MSLALPTTRRHLLLGASTLALPLTCPGRAMAAFTPTREAELVMGRHQSFDLGWRFHRGEGQFEASAIDESSWRSLDLPHDWSIEDVPGPSTPFQFGPFAKSAIGDTGTGFTLGGEGWYRKHFRLAKLAQGARVEALFGAVAVSSDVWLNGHLVGSHTNAYTPLALDLTPYISYDGDNVLVVRARNIGRNSRWYAGSGLYRSVTLDVIAQGARLARWGVAAWTRRIANGNASVDVTTTVLDSEAGLRVHTRLKDQAGRVVAQALGSGGATVRQTLEVGKASLWSPSSPSLYTIETSLLRGGREIDRTETSFGLRIIAMSPTEGLTVNGERTVLRGGCIHHDNGLLGAAAFADADDRRIRLLKQRGFNALRSSHNPASRSLLDACDRHGMLLIVEAFDTWHIHKRPDDHAGVFPDTWRQDLAEMVLPSRSHPCVLMWSIGNEVPERSSKVGLEWSWKLSNELRRLDPTRPVTAACQEFLGRPLMADADTARAGQGGKTDQPSTVFLDVAGYNYKLGDIEGDHALYPDRLIYASETYPHDAWDYTRLASQAPYMLGEFVWTAMDYVGEAGVGLTQRVPKTAPPYNLVSFPVYNAFCGDIDLIGRQKPQSFYRDVVWGLSPLEMLVQRPVAEDQIERIPLWGWSDELASWSWSGFEGKPLMVRAYCAGDRVECHLNGRLIGEKRLTESDKMKAQFSVPYEAGRLETVAFRGGVEIGRKVLLTAGPATHLRIRAEGLNGYDRQSLCFLDIDAVDRDGRPVPDANAALQINLDGPAELIGFGNAGPRAQGSFQASKASTWHGSALAILRAKGVRGTARIEVTSPGLIGASTLIRLA